MPCGNDSPNFPIWAQDVGYGEPNKSHPNKPAQSKNCLLADSSNALAMRKSTGNPILRFICGFIWLTGSMPDKGQRYGERKCGVDFMRNATRSGFLTAFAAAALMIQTVALFGQTAPAAPVAPTFAVPATNDSYADIADLVVISPLIVDAQVRKVTRVPVEQAVGVQPNVQRMLIEADVLALIRGDDGIPAKVRFLLDVPKDAKGKIPKLKKQRYLLLGSKATGLPGTIKLSRPDAVVEWSAGNDAMLRAITKEAVIIDAPQAIVNLTSAFHSPGTVIGAGETQIFVQAKGNQIYSLSIFSQPGEAKRWAVSTGEVIDESATAPEKNSLLWYRLACGLPKTLDAKQVETADPENVPKAQADYGFVLESLGPCDRKRRVG
jgi:hypothetical protein